MSPTDYLAREELKLSQLPDNFPIGPFVIACVAEPLYAPDQRPVSIPTLHRAPPFDYFELSLASRRLTNFPELVTTD
jgi:hypothetical protein